MRVFILLITIFLAIPVAGTAQGLEAGSRLSDSARISLITGSPGTELYTRFGHSAIRVYDPVRNLDIVFNYGTFNFNTPGFYVKFIRGKLLYYLSAYDFGRMHNEYIYLNQSLFEQVLNLSADEKEEVFEFLLRNYEPENRSYLYDFYFDNCSSRIRDVFQDILGDKLKFRYEHITEQKSFRQLTDEQLGKAPWGRFGIDLALGMPADKIAAPWDRMFLPYEMMYCFEQAVITADSTEELFASPVSAVHTAKPFDEPIAFFTPGRVFWLIFMLVFLLTIFQVYQNTNIKHLDTAIFTVLGLAGCFILFLWLGTDHRVTKMNLNILWAFPADLILIYFLLMKSRSPWLKYLLVLKIGMNILILAGWNFLPQSFHAAIIPLILINISRGGHLYWLSLRSRFNVEPKS